MTHPLKVPQEAQPQGRKERFGFQTFLSANGQYPENGKYFQSLTLRGPYFKTNYGSQHTSVENDIHNKSNFGNYDNNLIPLPDWPVAFRTWGPSWELHTYGFSVLFLVLTLLCTAVFVRFRLRVKRLKIVYNTLILLATAGIFRAVFMLVDPYGNKGRMAGLMVGIMTQAVYPLFCACYGLTQVMLLRITNVNVGRSRLRSLSCLMGCTLTYLFVVVIIETFVYYQRSAKLLLLLDSGCFIVWSLSLGITFICSGFRLTQYATETKKARKELNAFCNHRRTTSNTTWLSAISSAISDTSPTTTDAQTLSRAVSPTSYSVLGDMSLLASSPTFVTPNQQLPLGQSHRCQNHPRLSRPRLKISNQNHMRVTIATDEDDESTSSTDIDGPRCDNAPKRVKRVRRKNSEPKRSNCKNRAKSGTPVSHSVYRAISVTDESCPQMKLFPRRDSQSSGSDEEITNAILLNSAKTNNNIFNAKPDTCTASQLNESQQTAPSTASATLFNQAELESIPLQHPQTASKNIIRIDTIENEADFHDKYCAPDHKNITNLTPSTLLPHHCPSPSPFSNQESSPGINSFQDGEITESLFPVNDHVFDINLESVQFSSPPDIDHISSSLRENGYLADTENIFMSSSFSRLSNSLRRKLNPRSDVSSQRTSCDSNDSPTSPVITGKMTPNMSASLGLFRIRQSGMVQRAVHLTYLLTFLFLFACLLQLYTVFGVYGVLGSIRKPDPWPWLIFHTIFRATEVSIGLTTAAIAYITLNYRHQRARRRYQQQQNHLLAATRDCIV